MRIKNIIKFTLLFMSLLVSGGCKKKKYVPKYTDAIITGIDGRKCMCCGGPMITFSQDEVPYSADFKLITNSLDELGITDNTQFPLYVSVLWEEDTTRCKGYFVKLKAHKIR